MVIFTLRQSLLFSPFGATIYGTDVKGDIVMITDGQTYNMTTEK